MNTLTSSHTSSPKYIHTHILHDVLNIQTQANINSQRYHKYIRRWSIFSLAIIIKIYKNEIQPFNNFIIFQNLQ